MLLSMRTVHSVDVLSRIAFIDSMQICVGLLAVYPTNV
jgi:hypothetical protein